MWQSNSAGRTINLIGCRSLQPIWSAAGSAVIAASGGTVAALAAKAATADHSHRLRCSGGPRPDRTRRQPQPARRQRDRLSTLSIRSWSAKRLGSCTSWCRKPTRFAVLVNPTLPRRRDHNYEMCRQAARCLGLQIDVFTASTSREIDAAFASLVRRSAPTPFWLRPHALFTERRVQLVTLAARHALPDDLSSIANLPKPAG